MKNKKEKKKVTSTSQISKEDLAKENKKRLQKIEDEKENNKTNNTKGEVACDKLPHRFSGNKWPEKEGFKTINVCSSSRSFGKGLSPMIIGPIKIDDYLTEEQRGNDGYEVAIPTRATNIENLWQFSKVWDGEHDENNDKPKKEFFERRNKGWADKKPHRWVKKGKDSNGNRNISKYSWWAGEKLSYLEARRKIYCPIYAAEVIKTDSYKQLKKLNDDGYNLLLIGYDGYDPNGKTLKECFNDISRPFGHELVLLCLLKGEKPWEQ
jgi:hypothetical protein